MVVNLTYFIALSSNAKKL